MEYEKQGDFKPPSSQEIADYAKYLGLDPVGDLDLFWIAEAALCAPLPKGWGEYTDANGNVYFHQAKEVRMHQLSSPTCSQ